MRDVPFEIDDEQTFTLEFKPQLPTPPPTLVIRRKNRQAPLVVTEEEGLELYLLLKSHYEGTDDTGAKGTD